MFSVFTIFNYASRNSYFNISIAKISLLIMRLLSIAIRFYACFYFYLVIHNISDTALNTDLMNKLNYSSKSLLLALKLLLDGSLMNISYFALHVGEEKNSFPPCFWLRNPCKKRQIKIGKETIVAYIEVKKGIDKGLGTQRKESNS